jgi:hypothetical protein
MDAAQDLTLELEHLHHSLDEMVDRYRVRIGAQLVDLLQLVKGDATLGEKPKPLGVKATRRMLDAIRSAELKPKKGRAKDFTRLQDLVGALTEDFLGED